MIVCVTPNPALDRTLLVPNFVAGKVSRAQTSLAAAGGKGINVARAIHNLGGEAFCNAFLGGVMGRYIAELAEQEGISGKWTWVDGETRTCIIVADAETGEATVINDLGPAVTADDWTHLHHDVMQALYNEVSCVCFSGSLPPGSPVDAYLSLIQYAVKSGKQVWVDTSGVPLEKARHIPYIGIKVNGDEAGAIFGKSVIDVESARSAALELQQAGPNTVVLTLGALGAVMVHADGRWYAKPPTLKVVDPIGSGDSFLAGLVTSLNQGDLPGEALRRAVAAGAANALSVGGGQFPISDFDRVLTETTLITL
jgi:1-phosphofructokinase family hexose kinase